MLSMDDYLLFCQDQLSYLTRHCSLIYHLYRSQDLPALDLMYYQVVYLGLVTSRYLEYDVSIGLYFYQRRLFPQYKYSVKPIVHLLSMQLHFLPLWKSKPFVLKCKHLRGYQVTGLHDYSILSCLFRDKSRLRKPSKYRLLPSDKRLLHLTLSLMDLLPASIMCLQHPFMPCKHVFRDLFRPPNLEFIQTGEVPDHTSLLKPI